MRKVFLLYRKLPFIYYFSIVPNAVFSPIKQKKIRLCLDSTGNNHLCDVFSLCKTTSPKRPHSCYNILPSLPGHQRHDANWFRFSYDLYQTLCLVSSILHFLYQRYRCSDVYFARRLLDQGFLRMGREVHFHKLKIIYISVIFCSISFDSLRSHSG